MKMKEINLAWGLHDFVKLSTTTDTFGVDKWQCRKCGLIGNRIEFSQFISVSQTIPDSIIFNCNMQTEMNKIKPNRIKIYNCRSHAELKLGEIYPIAKPPEGKRNWEGGIWIEANGKIIFLVYGEFMLYYEPTSHMARLRPESVPTVTRLNKPTMGRLKK